MVQEARRWVQRRPSEGELQPLDFDKTKKAFHLKFDGPKAEVPITTRPLSKFSVVLKF